MIVSRWKVMVGVLGVSVGGLAAIAAQCPKDTAKTHRADTTLLAADTPKVPPAGSGPAVPPVPVVSPTPVLLPSTGGDAPVPVIPVDVKPATAPATPPKPVDLPVVPDFKPADARKPDMPKPVTPPAVVPPAPSSDLPALPPMAVEPTLPPTPPAVLPGKPTAEPAKPVEFTKPTAPELPPAKPVEFTKPAASLPPSVPATPEPIAEVKPAPTKVVPAAASVPAETKYRIVLRVGEGEPTFEVRCGDDLIMKVKSEKVDIKSPEKGSGLSAVTATGRVRFVGFGAEGTCESLSFLAGTGEVSMAGAVKVQVKDKIGRVESELTAEKMQYRLDGATLPGILKP